MPIDVRLLGPADAAVLERVAPGVFDGAVVATWAAECLADPRHHLVVAIDGGVVVGMASAVHYLHPDKAPQLWINEVGVAPTHRGRGVGTGLLERLVQLAVTLGCTEAWVLTDRANPAARQLYERAGAEPFPSECLMYTMRIPQPPRPSGAGCRRADPHQVS